MKLLIIDGNNLAHRVNHVFSLSRPDGMDVSITYGVLHNLRALLNMFEPESVIMAWDGGIPKFRVEKVPSYKANRSQRDPDEYADMVRQMEELSNVALPLAGVLNIRRPRMEADDIMFHAAFMAMGYEQVIIISNDEDMIQASAMNGVSVYSPSKDRYVDADYVKEEYGISIHQFVHWKALQGDGSDNIKGVPGIGPKKATKLFQEYESLSGIINAAIGNNPVGTISGKMGENIREFGMENISKNVYVMALYADRTGARLAVHEELDYYQPANIKSFKDYLFSNSFVSLMEPDFYKKLAALKAPVMSVVRMPVICNQRFPRER